MAGMSIVFIVSTVVAPEKKSRYSGLGPSWVHTQAMDCPQAAHAKIETQSDSHD